VNRNSERGSKIGGHYSRPSLGLDRGCRPIGTLALGILSLVVRQRNSLAWSPLL